MWYWKSNVDIWERGNRNKKNSDYFDIYIDFSTLFTGCINNRKEDEQNSGATAVEIDDSNLESVSNISSENDIVYDFKNPEDSENIVVTPKKWKKYTIS